MSVWREGAVDRRGDHITLSSRENPLEVLAWLSPDRTSPGWFVVAFADGLGESAREQLRRSLDFYLTELDETDPWAYARYHASTLSNAVERVRWQWVAAGGK